MPPRPAPDLDLRREQITAATRAVAESDGWAAVTMRRIAAELGVTQPVIYSAFAGGRAALVDAVALAGFAALAEALEQVPAEPRARMQAYLDFATARPRVYEAMFLMPSELPFAQSGAPEVLQRAFAAIREGLSTSAEAGIDVGAEVVWASLHGLATLQLSGRIPASRAADRLDHLARLVARA
jgi:AcrR family transcriptional regulator